jgi:hypothetical protein
VRARKVQEGAIGGGQEEAYAGGGDGGFEEQVAVAVVLGDGVGGGFVVFAARVGGGGEGWWGESAAALLGEMGVLGAEPFDGNRLKYSNTLGGGGINWLTEAGFRTTEILQYIYPSDLEMSKANIKIVFMDYFMKEAQIINLLLKILKKEC